MAIKTRAKVKRTRPGLGRFTLHGFKGNMKTYMVKADSDEAFLELKSMLDKMHGVTVTSEAPTRRALAVAAPEKRRLPRLLRHKGLHVRDELIYAPEKGSA